MSEEEIDKFVKDEQNSEENSEIKTWRLQAGAACDDLTDAFEMSKANEGCIDDMCAPYEQRMIEELGLMNNEFLLLGRQEGGGFSGLCSWKPLNEASIRSVPSRA